MQQLLGFIKWVKIIGFFILVPSFLHGQQLKGNLVFSFKDTSYFLNDQLLDEKNALDVLVSILGQPSRIKKTKGYNDKTKETHFWKNYFFDRVGIVAYHHLNDTATRFISVFFDNKERGSTKKIYPGKILYNGKEIAGGNSIEMIKNNFPEFNIWGFFDSLMFISSGDRSWANLVVLKSKGLEELKLFMPSGK